MEAIQYTGKITWEEIAKTLSEYSKNYKIQQKEKSKRIKNNLQALTKRSKELNKPIPDEILAVIFTDQPTGTWFFEKYKEWF